MTMSKSRIADNTNTDKNNKSNDTQDGIHPVNLTTKLERRRRIEDLNEARRLREELTAF